VKTARSLRRALPAGNPVFLDPQDGGRTISTASRSSIAAALSVSTVRPVPFQMRE
jgi:hypothetical protein